MSEFFNKLTNNNLINLIMEKSTYILICFVVLVVSQNITKRIFNNIIEKNALYPTKQTVFSVLYSTIKYVIYFIIVLIILEILGFPTSTVLAAAGVGGIAIGLGAQSLISDVISGVFILLEAQFKLGDIIKVDNREGIVESISLRITTLRDGVNGSIYIIPNSKIGIVENMTRDYAFAIVDFTLPNNLNIDDTLTFIRQSLTHFQNPYIIDPPTIMGITKFNDQTLNVRISCKCEPHHKWMVEREIRYLIQKDLLQKGITITTTQHNVTINSK